MIAYDQASQSLLKEKLCYELWCLEYIYKTKETLEGKTDINTIKLRNKQPKKHVILQSTFYMGSERALKVINTMMALTFAASYKLLDMIFEWILEENKRLRKLQDVPWSFTEKIEKVTTLPLVYPPTLESQPWAKDYLLALYKNLLRFRHEIVHRNKFLISDDRLIVEVIEEGRVYRLDLSKEKLSALVKTTVMAAKVLGGYSSLGNTEIMQLKYYLDQIIELHGLPEFGQKSPRFINVILDVPEENGSFPADLRTVREVIRKSYAGVHVLFALKVNGLVNDEPSISWFFPIDSVPQQDTIELRPGNYTEFRIPNVKTEGVH